MKVLFVVEFTRSVNILKTQIELIIQLKNKKNITPFVIGSLSDEIKVIFDAENIPYKTFFATKKIDFKYIKQF